MGLALTLEENPIENSDNASMTRETTYAFSSPGGLFHPINAQVEAMLSSARAIEKSGLTTGTFASLDSYDQSLLHPYSSDAIDTIFAEHIFIPLPQIDIYIDEPLPRLSSRLKQNMF